MRRALSAVFQCSRGRTVGRPLRTKIRKVRTFFLTQESWDAHIFYPRRQKYEKGRSLCYTRASSARNLKGRTNYQTRASSVRQAKHHRAKALKSKYVTIREVRNQKRLEAVGFDDDAVHVSVFTV